MPKQPGDLSHIFENPVPNLDWLDVDEEAYRHVERLPKQNLDAVPDLVDAWTHHDMGTVHRVPALDPDTVREHKWASTEHMEDAELRNLVSSAVKDRLHAGWDAPKLAAWVRENVHPDHIAMLVPTLQSVANEHAMLGQMQRDVTFEVQDGSAIDEYHARLDLPAVPEENDQLNAFLAQPIRTHRDYNSSDLRTHVTEDANAQVARDRRASGKYEPPSADFQSAVERSLYRDLSQKMMAAKGRLSASLERRFARADSDAITTLASEQNLLGSVYVRPDQFRTCHDANDFFRRHHNAAEFILEMDKCSGCHFNREGGCSLIGKQVVKDIPYTEEVLAAEVAQLRDAGTLDAKTAEGILSRIGSVDVRDLLAEAHGVLAPVEVADYQPKYDAQQMQTQQQVVDAKAATISHAIPQKHASVVRSAYQAAYKGVHGSALQNHLVERFGAPAVVAAGSHIRPIVRMAGLLGNVVLDVRGFRSASEAKNFLTDNRLHPQFLLKEGCGGACGGPSSAPDPARDFPALTLINYGSIGQFEIEASEAVDKLEMNERISSERALELRTLVGSTNSWDIVQAAYMSPRPAAIAGPERVARVSTPQVTKKQVQDQFRTAAQREEARIASALMALIDREVEADTISTEKAAEAKQQVEERTSTRQQVLRDLAQEQERYARYKKAEADRKFVASMADLKVNVRAPGDVDVPTVDASVVRKSRPARISSTQRTSFRKRVVMAMNRGVTGSGLQSWIRNSFSPELYNSEANFLRQALVDDGRGIGAHYIDPRPYNACDQGAKQVADSPAPYVKAMGKCSGCVFKSANNRCQVYDRQVVAEVPEMPTVTQELSNPTPVGIDPSLEYGLGGYLDVDYNAEAEAVDLDVGFDDPMGELF